MTNEKTEIVRRRGWRLAAMTAALGALVASCLLNVSCLPSVAVGGTSGTGISTGPITAFGSIFVNGVEWDISGVEIDFDDGVGDESLLRVGMVVEVRGTLDSATATGVAEVVIFDDSIEGVIEDDPVDVVPGVTRQFVVLGQTISIDATSTAFSGGASFDGLAKDDVVEVSGLLDGGVIRATWLDKRGTFVPFTTEAELRGAVANASANPDGSGIFDLGNVTVRYGPDVNFDGMTAADLVDGAWVEARGVLRTIDELDADEIELETEGLAVENADDIEITGFVSGFTALDQPFSVNGVPVDATGAVIDPPAAVIANGVEVEVEGALVAGVVIAEEISVED